MAAPQPEGSTGLRIIMLLRAAWEVPLWEYAILLSVILAFFIYQALELYFLEDLRSVFRGHRVELIYNHASALASQILPDCRILKRRYWPTPWLCSPHLQTAFLHFFGQPPQFSYYRQLYRTPDGGTIALDWLDPLTDVNSDDDLETSPSVRSANEIPIVVIIPGLTSDSADAYIKHIAYSLAASGWRVVVANHRGLGGVSITSNQLYNAGWTEDLRRIIVHLHNLYPNAKLLAVGTSIGANILVKYLGEEGSNTLLGGAAAICCPWDLLVCDRFITRRMIQRIYDKILAFGLRSYAELHQAAVSQIADWELISKSRSIRDFDNHCTRVVSQYETVDTYYRKSSSAYYLHSVSIPLFCVSSLDDPVCTKEAIPLDECRSNKNVVLALTRHGGHLAYFEGLTAQTIWWVRATKEFLRNLSASELLHVPKQMAINSSGLTLLPENVMDKYPYVSLFQNGVAAAGEMTQNYVSRPDDVVEEYAKQEELDGNGNVSVQPSVDSSVTTTVEKGAQPEIQILNEHGMKLTLNLPLEDESELIRFESTLSHILHQLRTQRENLPNGDDKILRCPANNNNEESSIQASRKVISNLSTDVVQSNKDKNATVEVKKDMKVLTKTSKQSFRKFAYIAILSIWPIIGSILLMYGRKRLQNLLTRYWQK